MKKNIFYGIDAPNIVCNLLLVVLLSLAGVLIAPRFFTGTILFFIQATAIAYMVCCALAASYMLFSSLVGKVKQRDKLLQSLALRGDEIILDVGSGRGLYAIGAASYLTSGNVVAIDIWQSKDLSSNSADALIKNAEYAGVADRIEVVTADAKELPFPDSMFDVVLSSFVIHNIAREHGIEKALAEMMRVLKPGGVILIQDFTYTHDYANYFHDHDLSVDLSSPQFLIFPFGRVVRATKSL